MKKSEQHQAEIDHQCKEMEGTQGKGLVQAAGRLLMLIGLKKQAEETERMGEPRLRGRPKKK